MILFFFDGRLTRKKWHFNALNDCKVIIVGCMLLVTIQSFKHLFSLTAIALIKLFKIGTPFLLLAVIPCGHDPPKTPHGSLPAASLPVSCHNGFLRFKAFLVLPFQISCVLIVC